MPRVAKAVSGPDGGWRLSIGLVTLEMAAITVFAALIFAVAGLVIGRREGRRVYYRIEPRGMKPLIDWIAHYRVFWTEHVDRLEQLLDRMDQ